MDIRVINHLYLHVPFCHRRCSYCDFNTYANMDDRIDAYVDALCTELRLRAAGLQPATNPGAQLTDLHGPLTRRDLLPTIFFGGGTPTMLSLQHVERILDAASAIVALDGAEITMEANPGTVLGGEYLRGLRGLGVNRLSMGIQTLHDPTLRVLGRIHTAAEARQSYADARSAGFERINLDFIFGLPGQTVDQWDATLREIGTWGADHFSLYSLILEEGTPLHAQVLGGRIQVPDDDVTGAMYEQAIALLGATGFVQYEISNWATAGSVNHNGAKHTTSERKDSSALDSIIPAQACHHNLAYWLNADYLAAGAGAHGHVFPRRYHDVLRIDEYIAAVRGGALPTAETINLDASDLRAETMFMGLRLNVGVGYEHFRERCGVDMQDVYGAEVRDLCDRGLLMQDAAGVRLTERGRMLGNQVFAVFV